MADYSQVNDYSAKDALSTGDPLKLIKGSDVDAEFSAISTAVATKFDSTDIATAGEAQAGTSNTVVITPARLTAWGQNGAGVIEDLQALQDPDADRLLFWDDSAGATAFLTVSTGLTLSGTTLTVNEGDFARTVTAGNGLSGGGALSSDISLAIDFNELTTATSIATGDLVTFLDLTGTVSSKITFANLESALTVANMSDGATGGVDHSAVSIATAADSGLTGGGDITATRNLSVDIAGTTQETTIDSTNDEVLFYDASAAANRAVPIESLVGTALGEGRWYRSSVQALSAATEATVAYNASAVDTLTRGTFSTSTGIYTAGSDGATIFVTAGISVDAQAMGDDSYVQIQQNGTDVGTRGNATVFSGYGASTQQSSCQAVVVLTSGQQMRVRAYNTSAKNLEAGQGKTAVSIVELR
jgi:hypothetical protein